MPSVKEITKKSKFVKKEYRAWNESGEIINDKKKGKEEKIVEIDPNHIIRWVYKNRPQNELNELDKLSASIQQNGQQEPCIIRPCKNDNSKYELITGERRWRVAKKLNILLKVVIRELSDLEASIAQKEENEKNPISDYANYVCYSLQMKDGILTRKDLIEKHGYSKQYVSRLLSYKEIPSKLLEAIGDMTKVSCGTAEKIKQISKNGSDSIEALILLSDKIASGKLGYNSLQTAVSQILSKKIQKEKKISKVHDRKGTYLFSCSIQDGANTKIIFSKKLTVLLKNKIGNIDTLLEKISEVIKDELENT